jgi:hypothetical protein
VNSAAFDAIVAKIPEMTKQQMTDLRRRLLFFIGNTQNSSTNKDWILEGILSVIRERGMVHMIPPNFRIKNNKSFAEYETQADRVRELLSDAIPEMSVTEQRSIGVLAARALATHLAKFTDVNLHNMLFYVARIPEALDDSYPNYLASGTLGFLIRRTTTSNQHF